MSKKDKEEKEIKDAAKTAEAENDGMKNESAGDNAGEADTDKVTETPETADDIDADSSEDDKKDNAKNESSKKDPKDVMIADLQDS